MSRHDIAVVVPAHQAGRELPACLEALFESGFAPSEIVVVDDGSRDATGALARKAGVAVVRHETPQGPAKARNRGAAEVAADILVFVDADVVVHPGARRRILAAFGDAPDLAALFGSYDDAPPAPRLVSRYRNLLHHYTHQTSRREAATFWTGFGAMRRAVFEAQGGFDKRWQDIEDVELGNRVRQAGGRIRLDPELLCTHLKAWTLRSMLRTDFRGRAIPWTRLMRTKGLVADDLNLSASHRASALMVVLFGLGLVGALFHPAGFLVSAAALVGFAVAGRAFLDFLVRTQGFGFALGALPFHALHYVAALCGYGYVVALDAFGASPNRQRAGVGSAEQNPSASGEPSSPDKGRSRTD